MSKAYSRSAHFPYSCFPFRFTVHGNYAVTVQLCCNRKQSWLWMQGDIYRAKLKERERFGDRPEISRILTGVDDMSITDPYLTKDFEYDNRIDYNEPVGTDYSRVRCPIAFCDLHLSLFSFPKKYTSYINAVSNRPAAEMTQGCEVCIFIFLRCTTRVIGRC